MVIELADVRLCASPREESGWEEGPARQRALAAKQAQLAAAELERLAKAGSQVAPRLYAYARGCEVDEPYTDGEMW